MNLFDLLIVQPIFNVLILIYGILPGNDFGVALIIFTVLVRLIMWPMVKKQLHQTKVMREIQPELKKIKERTKGNKQLEAQLMMELYREKGVNPFSSIGLLIVQLPILIALYRVIVIMTQSRDEMAKFTYNFLEGIPAIKSVVANPDTFNETLFGIIDLTRHAIEQNGIYIPALIMAFTAAGLQYYQSKQLAPKPEEGKRLRDLLSMQAKGKEVDQSEISAAVSSRMLVILPLVTLGISLYLPGALVLYFAVTSLVAVIQQHIILTGDAAEMDTIADKNGKKAAKPEAGKASAAERAKNAKTAEVIESPPTKKQTTSKKSSSAKRKRKRR
jgi:YidC/Oxa1 family membrane protein insertase